MGQTFTNGGVIYDILRSLKQQRSVKKQNKRKYSALALNLSHAMYLRFVVCFFVEVVVVVVVVWLYLFCFLLTVTCFFVCSFFPCLLVFCRCGCYFCLFVVVLRLYANSQLTRCSLQDPQHVRGDVTQSLYSVIFNRELTSHFIV